MYRTDLELNGMITDRREAIRSIWRAEPTLRTSPPRSGRVRRALGRRIVSIGLALVG